MATLKSNGKCIAEMIVRRRESDNAESDEMTQTTTSIYRAMESGKVLKKVTVIQDLGIGKPTRYDFGWKFHGRIKKSLNNDFKAIQDAMHGWCESLQLKGIDAEIS